MINRMNYFSQKRLKRIAAILCLQILLPLLFVLICAVPALAADDLTTNDAVKGLMIYIGIVFVAKVAKSMISDLQHPSPKPQPSVDKNPPNGYTDSDLELLARLIFAEARSEPYEGKVAVGAVVLNRIKSGKFPHTIKEVIYAPGQFTCVVNGQINLTPDASAYQAARDALAGKDPSNGALFFYNPKTAKNMDWFRTLHTTAVIGGHVFAN